MLGTRERIRVTIDEGWLRTPNAVVPAGAPSVEAAPPQWIAEAAERPVAPRTVLVGRKLAWKRILALGSAIGIATAFAALVVHTYVIGGPVAVANGVPLIKADTTPWRIRPAEEGGMEVPNQDRLVLQDLGATVPPATVRGFLPPPEKPLPRPTLASITGGGGVLSTALVAPIDQANAVEVLIGREDETQQGSTPASSEGPVDETALVITPTLAPTAPEEDAVAEAAPALVSDLSGGDELALLIDTTDAPAETTVAALGPAEAPATTDPWPEIAPSPTLPPITVSTAAGPVAQPVLPAAIAPAFAALDAPAGAITPTDTGLPPVAPLAGGAYAVQIAAVSSEEEVTVEWDRFRRRYPDIFGRLELRVQKIEGATRLGYRVQAGPLDAATAKAVCAALVGEKTGCLVVGG
jgi:hypothetical protein